MPKTLTITIKSACATEPSHPHMSLAGYNQVKFHSAPPNLYYLVLPGGLFVDHPTRFVWPVFGATDTAPLDLVSPLPTPTPVITNYVFDPIGRNCQIPGTADAPPDIIIESGARPKKYKKT